MELKPTYRFNSKGLPKKNYKIPMFGDYGKLEKLNNVHVGEKYIGVQSLADRGIISRTII